MFEWPQNRPKKAWKISTSDSPSYCSRSSPLHFRHPEVLNISLVACYEDLPKIENHSKVPNLELVHIAKLELSIPLL